MEIRCFILVKAGLVSHSEVMNMNFEEFEQLEKFNILSNEIEEKQQQKTSSFKGEAQSKAGALSIKNNGTYKRE